VGGPIGCGPGSRTFGIVWGEEGRHVALLKK